MKCNDCKYIDDKGICICDDTMYNKTCRKNEYACCWFEEQGEAYEIIIELARYNDYEDTPYFEIYGNAEE